MDQKPKLPLKHRILSGFIMAVIGTIIVSIINHFRDLPFNPLYTIISFILFWAVGIFIAKPKSNNNPLD